jgi:hypothetical protein
MGSTQPAVCDQRGTTRDADCEPPHHLRNTHIETWRNPSLIFRWYAEFTFTTMGSGCGAQTAGTKFCNSCGALQAVTAATTAPPGYSDVRTDDTLQK